MFRVVFKAGLGVILIFGMMSCAPDSQTSVPQISVETSAHPFNGCWRDVSGLEREVWTSDTSGWLVGYATNRNKDGDITVFEHMRIEQTNDGEVLVVTDQRDDTVRFMRRLTDDPNEFRFENLKNTYPQVIRYKREDRRLDAWVAKADGSQKISFTKVLCDTVK